MGLRYAPNYPDGIEVWRWKEEGIYHWTVEYTPPGIINSRSRVLGIIRQPTPDVYVVKDQNVPQFRSKGEAVWWLYYATTGFVSCRNDREEI